MRCRLSCLLLPFALFGCGPRSPDSSPVTVQLSPEAAQLFDIAGDEEQPYGEREKAVTDLKKLGRDGVPALIRLLPGRYDVITFDAVNALGEIGDPTALPKLREMQHETKVVVPGKINAAIHHAIEVIEPRQRQQP